MMFKPLIIKTIFRTLEAKSVQMISNLEISYYSEREVWSFILSLSSYFCVGHDLMLC